MSAVLPGAGIPAERLRDVARPGRRAWHAAWPIAGASLWMASIGNLALWREMHALGLLDRAAGLTFGVALMVMVAAATALLLSLFAWRRSLKPAIAALLVATALGAHFMWTYRIVIDPTMIANLLQTDLHEARDLLGARLLLDVLLVAGVPLIALWRLEIRFAPWRRQALHAAALFVACIVIVVGLALAFFQPLAGAVREHKPLRYMVNPLNSVHALVRNVHRPAAGASGAPVQTIGEDARLGASHAASPRPPLLVLVLGETARAVNFGLNGYARATTPELGRLHVASFRNAWSCGTSTAASVPCMFSHLQRAAFEGRRGEVEGLLDVVQRAGLAVLWVDNQSGCKGVCARVPSVSTAGSADAGLCRDGECLDEIMLKGLDDRIAALPAERRARGTLVVLHQMGSHGPAYDRRSPAAFKRFGPECRSRSLPECSRQEIVDAYDNSIAYTDHFLAETVRWLTARRAQADTAMVYVADHGESLGEGNLYLHGLPYAMAPDVQKRVPWITWLSPEFEARRRLSTGCLQARADERVSHDHYFHSVIGLLDVQTAAYAPAFDAYAPCIAAP